MRTNNAPKVVVAFLLALFAWTPAQAQRTIAIGKAAGIAGASPIETHLPNPVSNPVSYPVSDRVVERIDEADRVILAGNTHPLARPQYDQGLADPQLPMERIVMLLQRSPQQESALEAFMAQQYDPKSANFHHWLQPEEFGSLYGPSDSDIAAVTSWLQNHGFQIYLVNKGRVTLEFSGTAAQVQEAFHVEMHHYLVNGKMHLANDRDPSIPEALAPVIGGIASLHDFFPTHQSILGRYVRRNPKTGLVTPAYPDFSGPTPEFGFTNENGNPQEDITPYDFATIYNLLPLWNAGITGKGQTIAISAVTDIQASDVNTFRQTFGLGSFTGTFNEIHNGTDPGVLQGALEENTLDTEWSGATAPDATVDLVVSASTATTPGFLLSDQYIVENPSLFTIMSASYGTCEIALLTAGNSAANKIYQQGAAAGISMFESSGDQGSAGCDNSDATEFPNPAANGLNVNGYASSPWITAVGGTEFEWVDYRTTYWGSNSSANGSNALGYIPEGPWNGSCTNQMLLDRYFNYFYGYTTFEQACNESASPSGIDAPNFVTVSGGSGGVSSCITSNGSSFASCGGGYPQPSYQKGITGMPGTTARYLPDVSLFASDGFPYRINGSAYLICVASHGGGSCDYTNPDEVIYQEVGGTSVSSPALAGIMALVQQKQNGAPQGLANPVFYALFSKENLSNCNSTTVTNGNSCIFYDITYGNNSQVCTTGSRNCVTNTSGDAYGVVSGYSTTTGYDQATGLGSVNATNLVNAWASVTGLPAITLSPTTLTFASTTVGSTTAAQVVTVKNTGTATATLTSETVTGTNASSFVKSSTTCGATLAAGATCTVSVQFKPAAAGALSASLAIADNATGSPQTVALSGTGTAASTFTVSLAPTALAFGSTAVGSTNATVGVVTVKNTGTGTVTLTSETVTGTNASSFVKSSTTCGATLAAGATCTVSVQFKPAAAGALSASLSIADNATGSPQTVALTGTGTAASSIALSVTPTSIAFPTTVVGATSAAQVVTLKNTGSATATFSTTTFIGADPTSFTETATTCGATLAAGASCTVSVAFKPLSAIAETASLSVSDNAAGSPQTVALTGTGAAAAAPALTLTPTSIAFPNTVAGTASDAQIVTLKNTGAATLTLTSIALTGSNTTSFAQIGTCGATLAASATCQLYVAFTPNAAAALTATIAITDNASGSPQKVTLTGTGTAAPSVKLSVATIAFPTTTHGTTSAAVPVTLTNAGTATLDLTSIALAGTNPTDFEALSTCATTLAPAASCTVYVAFKPATAAAFSAKLTVTDNGSASPQSVALSGTGK